MCIQIVECYAVCRCIYHTHDIDQCKQYPQPGHTPPEKRILVGYLCPQHRDEKTE
ncbi:hypothetical protein DM02DRAFT_479494, partial [Periconia macrospinosa]